MSRPIVIAYHLIWSAYGWWLPNDPRGSGSRTVQSDVIAELGELHFGRKRVQPCGSDVREFYQRAFHALKHPLLVIDADAREQIAESFADVIREQGYTCYACAIMPDHVHILIRKHRHRAEQMMELLKAASLDRLIVKERRPVDHPVWTGGTGWKVFLDHPEEVRRTVRYIERNPRESGLPSQHWSFVRDYDGWTLPQRPRDPRDSAR